MKIAARELIFSIAATLVAFPVTAFAQFQNPLRSDLNSVAGFTEALLRAMIFILFPLAVVFVVYSGFLFVAAQGKPDDLAKAKSNFLWTIIGTGLLLGAYALAALIKGTIDPILGN